MKKVLKILFINISLLIFIFVIAELSFCIIGINQALNFERMTMLANNQEFKPTLKRKLNALSETISKNYIKDFQIEDHMFRCVNPSFYNNQENKLKKNPIILLGCSYTHGFVLNPDETFNAVLQEKTNRLVYNFGLCGGGAKEMLYTLQNNKIIKDIKPDYVIYTYIPHHKNRLYSSITEFAFGYKPINNFQNLKFQKENKIIHNSIIRKKLVDSLVEKRIISDQKAQKLFALYMKQMNEEIKKLYGDNTKFVLFVYDNSHNENWEDLENIGIKIIIVENLIKIDLKDNQYRIPNDDHPNKKAWELVVPALVKELNL